jgi:DNA-binding MarR family transcriptional regulator
LISDIFEKSRYKSAYDVPGYLIRLTSSLWRRRLNAQLATIDLTEMQFVLLMGLGWIMKGQKAGVTQKELAEACDCSTALASQVLQILARKKLVRIAPNKKDARARTVSMTRFGEETLRKAVPLLEKAEAEFWGDEDEAKASLRQALRDTIEIQLNAAQEKIGRMPGFEDG